MIDISMDTLGNREDILHCKGSRLKAMAITSITIMACVIDSMGVSLDAWANCSHK